MRKLGRVLLRVAVALLIVVSACAIAGILVARSGWFRERVRERIIAEIEKSTGARAEVGSFTFDWTRLTATVSSVVIHGKEHTGDPPLLSVRSATVGLRVISMLERRIDLAYLRLDQPVARIEFYPDGSTNLLTHGGNWAAELLNIAIGRYEVNDGLVEYDDRKIPLTLRGENLRAVMTHDARGKRYRGDLASRRVRVMAGGFAPIEADVSAAFAIEASRIEITRLRAATRESHADVSGVLNDPRSPTGNLRVTAAIAVREAVELFQLPVARAGSAAFDGRISVSPQGFGINGRVSARGLGYARDRLKVDGASLRAEVRLTRDKLSLSGIAIDALGATISGAAELNEWTKFHFAGKVAGLSVRQAAAIVTERPIPWNGIIEGGFSVDAVAGQSVARVQTDVAITRAAEGPPIEGQIDAAFDQAEGKLRLGNSHVETPATRVEVSGTLGETLEVRARSTNLDDLIPALAMADADAPKELPIKLANGSATFNGQVSGPLDDPRVTGQAALTNASIEGHAFDRFNGEVDATRRGVRIQRATMARGATEVTGSGELAPLNEDGGIAAQLTVRNAQIAELAKEAGVAITITGTAGATIRLSGTLKRPSAEGVLQVEKPAGFGEQLDRLRADVRYSQEAIDVTAGEAEGTSGKILFQGEYRHAPENWKNGDVRFAIASQGLVLSAIRNYASLQTGVDSKIDGKADGSARIVNGEVTLTAVNGDLRARSVTWDQQALGDVSITAKTQGADLAVHASAKVRDISVDGEGSWRLTGDDPGRATIRFPRTSVASLHNVAMAGGPMETIVLPFEGFIDSASATVSVALLKPRDFHAELTVGTVQLNAKPAQTFRLGVQAQDVVVKNSQPVLVDISSKEARIRSARFIARDSTLEVSGAVAFDPKAGSDLTVHGAVNLIILQLLNPDLVARGKATVQASVRGSLRDPQLSGRMELNNASLYLSDLPNGVDNANGAVIFDRNRATIEKLTAETGGGIVTFAGFIGFGSTLVYRLQAVAQKVRVRYPEDVSVTFDATLALNGTPDSSTVSGVMTPTRASFTPHADLAQILAQASAPAPATDTSSDYIRGMQFDVRIQTGPNFELQTSLTRNLEAEVDLRLRGTPLRPAMLGTISVNEGEVQIFGNRYTVNRGDIRFVNPVKLEPILDMDLETKARSVTVNIAISGTMQKLNVNYSSDPPMQPSEIIALLAVGRAPTDSAGLNVAPSNSSSTSLVEAGGGLIGQAISAQLSSRLQRFFGASRVKVDPTLTGVEYLPQARLTIEQQVSNEITLTYITNLNRTQEQIVQIEWDFSRRWSAVAVREASGEFGIDFQYRKRFK
jgi:translocation and assembly module TamB